MGGSGDLVFSDSAADSMESALQKAGHAVGSLSPSDPAGFDLGDPTVLAAASDLFIGLHAFGQGLSVGVAHCEKSVSSSRDSLAAIDKQLEAAAAVAAPGTSSAFKRLPVTAGGAPGGVRLGGSGLTVTKVDLDSVGGVSHHKTTWTGTKDETKTETKSNIFTDESKTTHTETHTHTEADGTKSTTTTKTVSGSRDEEGNER